MKSKSFIISIICVFLLFIALFGPHIRATVISSEDSIVLRKNLYSKNNDISNTGKVADINTPYQDISINTNQGIKIQYPKSGNLYNRNTIGLTKPLLVLLNCSLVLDSNLEVGAEPYGLVDEVSFVLTTNEYNLEIDKKTDDSIEHGLFNCRFYSISSFFGVYEITAIAYYQGEEVARDSVSKIVFIQLGPSGNKEPIAIAKFSSTVWEDEEIDFDGSESFDPDGEIVSYFWEFGDGHTSVEMNPTHIYEDPGAYTVSLTVTDNDGAIGTDSNSVQVLDYDFGVWIVTKYQGVTDDKKLDIGVEEFVWMLHYGGGSRIYHLSMQDQDDTEVTIRFGKTTISGISTIMTQFQVEVDGSTDLSTEFEVNLEMRFPYSLLEGDNPPSEEYFSARIGYQFPGGSERNQGPHNVHTLFYFAKDSFSDPGILKMKIDPYPYGFDNFFPLTYTTSFLTVNEHEVEEFKRTFSVEFNPTPVLAITSVPREAKISYEFGDETAGETTAISFSASGGTYSDIAHRFILDPLPRDMNFDLTMFGERSFKYEASDSYTLSYIMDSVQNGNLVKLELIDLPSTMVVSWGLNINLGAKIASGFIDLDTSNNINEIKLYLQGSEKPFIHVANFPSKSRISSYIDVPNLRGDLSVSKNSGGETTISVPVTFDKWEITGTLTVYDGIVTASFDLPSAGNNHTAVGLDTGNVEMFGFEISVVDTQTTTEALYIRLGRIATDNLQISFDNVDGEITNLQWSGRVTKLLDLELSVNYQGADFSIVGSWNFRQSGSFEITLNTPVEAALFDIENDQFKLYGYISIYADRLLKLEWEWGSTGYITLFMPEPIGERLELEFGYGSPQSGVYQYGFRVIATDFLWITRTIMWDTVNANPVRIWVLGDNPIPGNWEIMVLWNYEWYPIPFP